MPGRERAIQHKTSSSATGSGNAAGNAAFKQQKRAASKNRKKQLSSNHNALSEDLHADKFVVPGQNARKRRDLNKHAQDIDEQANEIDNDMEAGMMDQKMARRILLQSKNRQQEGNNKLRKDGGVQANDDDDDEDEEDSDGDEYVDEDGAVGGNKMNDDDDDDEDYDDDDNNEHYVGDDDDDDEDVEIEYSDTESQAESEMVEFPDLEQELELDEEEARLLGKFQPQAPTQSRNLADIIMEKIREKEQGQKAAAAAESESQAGDKERDPNHIDVRVRRVYNAIGRILRGYTAGKIPKAFKILPRVQNWEQLVLLTRPENWSPHATYQATRIFAAALNERMAQRFYNAVLLPIIHSYIAQKKTLHPALYQALRKALFKPIAFYKGFLLPLCDGGECGLKEALIIGSVLQKMHLQPIPTAVVIVKICEMAFSSSNVLFLRVLVDKKMSLPFQAIDALVAFFHRFGKAHKHDDKLPVLWHQALLSFVQRYRGELKKEQIALLHEVCNKHFHQLITPEIRRELAAAVGAVSSYH